MVKNSKKPSKHIIVNAENICAVWPVSSRTKEHKTIHILPSVTHNPIRWIKKTGKFKNCTMSNQRENLRNKYVRNVVSVFKFLNAYNIYEIYY